MTEITISLKGGPYGDVSMPFIKEGGENIVTVDGYKLIEEAKGGDLVFEYEGET